MTLCIVYWSILEIIRKSQVVAALEAEREAKELYQSKLEESLRSDDTDDDISDIPTKIIGSPHRVRKPMLSCVLVHCQSTNLNYSKISKPPMPFPKLHHELMTMKSVQDT